MMRVATLLNIIEGTDSTVELCAAIKKFDRILQESGAPLATARRVLADCIAEQILERDEPPKFTFEPTLVPHTHARPCKACGHHDQLNESGHCPICAEELYDH